MTPYAVAGGLVSVALLVGLLAVPVALIAFVFRTVRSATRPRAQRSSGRPNASALDLIPTWLADLLIVGGTLAFIVGIARHVALAGGVGFWVALIAYLMRRDHIDRESQMKPCPDCAESVMEDARVCKHCGYRFATTIPTDREDA